jgi:hypothetical protein
LIKLIGKQEKMLAAVCVFVAAVCLYGAVKGFLRFIGYWD